MRNFSSKHLIIFFIVSLTLAFGSSLFISNHLGRIFSNDLRDRETLLLFGAIEAGPLAIARLNSSAFSQEALDRLMASPSLKDRAFKTALIVGGPEHSYNFAHWDSFIEVKPSCVQRIQKEFHYPESINSFQVLLSYDKCRLLAEEKQIYIISLIGITLVFVLVSIVLMLAILPIVQSLRATFLHLRLQNTSANLSNIKFLPLRNVAELALKSVQLESEAALAHLSKQVAHDIRSPLSALKMAIGDLDAIPNDSRFMIRNSIQRINDIANNLLKGNKETTQNNNFQQVLQHELEEELLYLVLDSLISEKRIQYRDHAHIKFEIDFKADHRSFVKINKSEFYRVLSNLINNSVEAIKSHGVITVSVVEINKTFSIAISDNGIGIPPHVLEKLGQRGFSHGKENSESGVGLGVYHAKETIKSFNGNFLIESTVGIGTKITIVLPKTENPSWFVGSIDIKDNKKIIVVDDDENIAPMWSKVLETKIESFTNGKEFKKEITSLNQSGAPLNYLCLVDYELYGQDKSGLDLIEELSISSKSILVTSRYDEPQIRERCRQLNIKLIPKSIIDWIVPATTNTQEDVYQYVFIDNDAVLRKGWERRAKKKNIKLLTLNSSSDFQMQAKQINKEHTLIYIDSDLGPDQMRGEDFAKLLHEDGYKKIYIASGYDAKDFAHLSWLNFAGKDCPF